MLNSFTPKWIDRYLHSQQRQDVISEPWAFYNCNDAWSVDYTCNFLNKHIDICNSIVPSMFERKISTALEQDTLNQIHSVFEEYHGQLDQWLENNLFKQPKGDRLRKSLSHINQTVHRLEGANNNKPKLRVVYFEIPKTETFTEQDYALFTTSVDFGGVYILYADVGKNLESLAYDQDEHHHDFVPNLHYSVDFVIRLYNDNGVQKRQRVYEYLLENLSYFVEKGYTQFDPRLTVGAIKLAQLQYENKQAVLDTICNYDNIQSVFII